VGKICLGIFSQVIARWTTAVVVVDKVAARTRKARFGRAVWHIVTIMCTFSRHVLSEATVASASQIVLAGPTWFWTVDTKPMGRTHVFLFCTIVVVQTSTGISQHTKYRLACHYSVHIVAQHPPVGGVSRSALEMGNLPVNEICEHLRSIHELGIAECLDLTA
jgi:hypothetical protein